MVARSPLVDVLEYLRRVPNGRVPVKDEDLKGCFRGIGDKPVWRHVIEWAEYNNLKVETDTNKPAMASVYYFTLLTPPPQVN